MARLTIAGCGDAFGSGGNHYACHYLHTVAGDVLIDCGATAMPSLKKLGLNGAMVDLIVISHLHGDHYAGLPFLLLDAAIMQGRKKPLHLAGPQALKDRLNQLFRLMYPGSGQVLKSFEIIYHTFNPASAVQAGPFSIHAVPVKHSKQTDPHGVRISGPGFTMAYSGDTGWTDKLIQLSAKADLFLCECNNLNTQMSMHLDLKTLTEKRKKIDCHRVVLTHLGNEMLERPDAALPNGYSMAYEGMEINFGEQ